VVDYSVLTSLRLKRCRIELLLLSRLIYSVTTVCKVPSEEDIRIKYEAEMLKVKQQYEAMFRAEQEARQRCVITVGLVLLYPLLTHRGVWLCVQGGDGTEGVPPILWHGHQHRHPGMW